MEVWVLREVDWCSCWCVHCCEFFKYSSITCIIDPSLLSLTFLQSIFHDGSPPGRLLAAGWPEERLDLPRGLFARVQAFPHPPEEPHFLLQQRHDLRVLLLQHFCPVRHGVRGDGERNSNRVLPSHRQMPHFFLTPHLSGFALQLSLVVFCLTGNPFILVLIPANTKRIRSVAKIKKIFTEFTIQQMSKQISWRI